MMRHLVQLIRLTKIDLILYIFPKNFVHLDFDLFFVNPGASDAENEASTEPREKKEKKSHDRKKSRGRKRRDKKEDGGESDSGDDRPKARRGRKPKDPKKKRANLDDGLSAKQKMRIVSKATISTSESDSDTGKLKIASG